MKVQWQLNIKFTVLRVLGIIGRKIGDVAKLNLKIKDYKRPQKIGTDKSNKPLNSVPLIRVGTILKKIFKIRQISLS